MKKKLSIVAPMYNEEEMAPIFYDVLSKIMDNIKEKYDSELVLVNDGSKDNTLKILKELKEKDPRVHVISFSRNYGQEPAVTAGVKEAHGDAVIIMDADLQDPPEIIYDLLKYYEEGYEVVNAKRVDRKKDTFLKRFTAEQYYNVIYKLSGKIKVPKNVGNYRLISRRVVDILNALPEKNHVFRVMVPYVGFKTKEVEFVRPARPKGETKYNFKAMFRLAGDSITSSSLQPLLWSFKFGIGLSAISFIALIICIVFYILQKNSVYPFQVWDNTFFITISVILLMFGLLFIFLGIASQYIGRIFTEVQNRPMYYIDENLDSNIEEINNKD